MFLITESAAGFLGCSLLDIIDQRMRTAAMMGCILHRFMVIE